MKRTAIALAIAGLAAATVAQAAPQANTFYAGAKAGWASSHHGLNQFKQKGVSINRNSEAYGVFGGYQITDNFAVEAGYEYFGRSKAKVNGAQRFRHTAHGTTLALKASYPVLDNLDVYGRVGAALIRSDYKVGQANKPDRYHNLKVSPVFAGGVEYAILPELALRAEYQWVSRVGNLGRAEEKADRSARTIDYSPDIGSVAVGLSYRFGQGVAPAPAPEVVRKTFSLNSDVTFAFGKANLKPQAQNTLDGIYGEIAQVNNANVQVAGYTDRIGSDAYNQKLSQRRAETVANYLVSKGVSQQAISATGHGKANPVTGNKCDAVKGRKALIACLADDRRVEIAVSGTK
ncbi:porin OmpA [Aggregatibacter actinomycetemcomitans]|uniref:porin OmpA n=1 Tax=Aggregatibacter actinomycetemcomitans TaxID=714 RepID=UPI001E40F619|nr:porin OmpA [Aggregatibacter actinomycetemcomitans]